MKEFGQGTIQLKFAADSRRLDDAARHDCIDMLIIGMQMTCRPMAPPQRAMEAHMHMCPPPRALTSPGGTCGSATCRPQSYLGELLPYMPPSPPPPITETTPLSGAGPPLFYPGPLITHAYQRSLCFPLCLPEMHASGKSISPVTDSY